MDRTKDRIRALAREAGFDAVGFARPELPAFAPEGLRRFVEEGRHGDMEWMEEKFDRRTSPHNIWPDVQSIIVVGQNYGPGFNPLLALKNTSSGYVSCYARGDDYHETIKRKLKALAQGIASEFGGEARVFVDTAPVMEKPLAQAAGLGWQGKHTCVVSREFGAWLFLGEIFTTLDLPPDASAADHCGTCTACLDVCPTGAFTAAREIDARKCISYLTIEHKGHIDRRYRKAIGNRVYGCDGCLAVCPWNKFASKARESAYHAREALASPSLATLAALDDAAFRALFRKSPVKRTGRDCFLRNVLLAIGNSGDCSLLPSAQAQLADPSPLVRAMAVWACAQLAEETEFFLLRECHVPHETDTHVMKEWNFEFLPGSVPVPSPEAA